MATIDGAICTTWMQVAHKNIQLGYGESVTADWSNLPIVVKSHNLFGVDTTFSDDIKSIDTHLQFLLNLKNYLAKRVTSWAYYQA